MRTQGQIPTEHIGAFIEDLNRRNKERSMRDQHRLNVAMYDNYMLDEDTRTVQCLWREG